jgi:hypothetical protein
MPTTLFVAAIASVLIVVGLTVWLARRDPDWESPSDEAKPKQ